MPDESESPVGHEAYSREHALWHVWKMSRYHAANEALGEMLMIETKQNPSDARTARISVLSFSREVLDHLIENELLEVHKELTTYLQRSGKIE
jgi:hypothetical protein